jgi:hypothetical protein
MRFLGIGLALWAALVTGPACGQTFTDITAQAGINVTGLGNTCLWFDYDDDGDLDLLATNSSFSAQSVWLYRNNGSLPFTDVTVEAGLSGYELRGAVAADYDNDGYVDISATTYQFNQRPMLFHNLGDGTFAEVSASSGMLGGALAWRTAWADFDRDGYVDLCQTNWTSRDYLYHNNGDGTFQEMGEWAGINAGAANSTIWGDYNNDGWPDLYLARDNANVLYRNDGNGHFTDVTATARVGTTYDSQGCAFGDGDNDGYLDLSVVNLADRGQRNILYWNRRNGTFRDIAIPARVQDVGDGRTTQWLDYDNDGDLDLFCTNHVHPNRLYRNNYPQPFTDVAASAGIANPGDVFECAWGDFDADGDLDVMLTGHFGNVLYRSNGNTNHYVELNLVGSTSNRSAIGTRVRCFSGGRSQYREVDGGTGSYGQTSLPVEFGLGTATVVDSLVITWPSGLVETYRALPANRVMTITEGTAD